MAIVCKAASGNDRIYTYVDTGWGLKYQRVLCRSDLPVVPLGVRLLGESRGVKRPQVSADRVIA